MSHSTRRQFLASTAALGIAGAFPSLLTAGQSATSAAFNASGHVYTADELGNSISAIDLETSRITTVPILITPHNVQITADGTRLLAVGSPIEDDHGHGGHGTGKAAGRLVVFEAPDLASGPAVHIAVGSHPAHVIADRQGRRAFVTNAGDDTISVVDLVDKTIIGIVRTGAYPHGLRMSPDGREIYVANVQDGSISVIAVETLTEVARIPVGAAPVQVGFTPDGQRVYVSLRDEDRVAVIDTASRTVLGTIAVGRGPIQVHATPDGRHVYVANQGTEAEPADTVSLIEVATDEVVAPIRTGNGAHGVAVSDEGLLAFVTNIVDATVSVIDTAQRRVVASFATGAGPNGITYRSALG